MKLKTIEKNKEGTHVSAFFLFKKGIREERQFGACMYL